VKRPLLHRKAEGHTQEHRLVPREVERIAAMSNDLCDALTNPEKQAVLVLVLQMVVNGPGFLKMPLYSVGWLRESRRMAVWGQIIRLVWLFGQKLDKADTQIRAAAILVSTFCREKLQLEFGFCVLTYLWRDVWFHC
jgi:hypothetical protein